MSESKVIYEPGGHAYYDDKTRKWVALSYVRILGRFGSSAEAREAIKAEAAKHSGSNGGHLE